MIRNLKGLGVILVAMLALTAVLASAAQAVPEITCSSYPCKGTGSNTVGGETLTTPGGTVQCNSHIEWEKYRTATGESLPAGAPTATTTVNFFNCTAFGFLSATVNMEGCDYEGHVRERMWPFTGKYRIEKVFNCPAAKKKRITAGTCEVDVEPQNLGKGVTTTNNANGTINVEYNMTGITMNVTKDGFGCPFSGTGHVTGSYHGEVTISRVGGGSISVSGE